MSSAALDIYMVQTISSPVWQTNVTLTLRYTHGADYLTGLAEECYTHPEICTWCRPSPHRFDRRQPLSSAHGRDIGLRLLSPWCRWCRRPSFYPQSWRWVIPAICGAIKRKINNRWTFLRNTLRLPIQTLISMAPTRLVFWRTTQFQENEHNPELKHCLFLVTTRKRSLGQGNMFTSVCLSTGGVPAPGGCLLLGGAWSWGMPGPGSAWSRERVPGPEGLVQEGAWSGGTCSWGGTWWRPPRLLLRAVRILLECILVFFFLNSTLTLSKAMTECVIISQYLLPINVRGSNQVVVNGTFLHLNMYFEFLNDDTERFISIGRKSQA